MSFPTPSVDPSAPTCAVVDKSLQSPGSNDLAVSDTNPTPQNSTTPSSSIPSSPHPRSTPRSTQSSGRASPFQPACRRPSLLSLPGPAVGEPARDALSPDVSPPSSPPTRQRASGVQLPVITSPPQSRLRAALNRQAISSPSLPSCAGMPPRRTSGRATRARPASTRAGTRIVPRRTAPSTRPLGVAEIPAGQPPSGDPDLEIDIDSS